MRLFGYEVKKLFNFAGQSYRVGAIMFRRGPSPSRLCRSFTNFPLMKSESPRLALVGVGAVKKYWLESESKFVKMLLTPTPTPSILL